MDFSDISLLQYALVCLFVFTAGFIDAIAGGGGLISLPGYIIAGLPVHYAIATNKLSATLGTVAATINYIRKGYVNWKLALGCIVTAMIGSAIGAKLALITDERILKIMMLVILPLIALYLIRSRSFAGSDTKAGASISTGAMISGALIAFGIGIYDGLYGPGTGTFLIIMLVSLSHLSLREANGTAKVLNSSTNIASLAIFVFSGKVLWVLALTASVFSVLGNYAGAAMFSKGGVKIVRPVMLSVIAIFVIKLIWELWLS